MSTWRKPREQTGGTSRDTSTRIHGLAVFAECLAVGLACGDQRQLTGSGSALEALRDDAYFTLLFFIRGRPDGLFQPYRGSTNIIFLASMLLSIHAMPKDGDPWIGWLW